MKSEDYIPARAVRFTRHNKMKFLEFINKIQEFGFKHDHDAKALGYISCRVCYWFVVSYIGKLGRGYAVHVHSDSSDRAHHIVQYYLLPLPEANDKSVENYLSWNESKLDSLIPR